MAFGKSECASRKRIYSPMTRSDTADLSDRKRALTTQREGPPQQDHPDYSGGNISACPITTVLPTMVRQQQTPCSRDTLVDHQSYEWPSETPSNDITSQYNNDQPSRSVDGNVIFCPTCFSVFTDKVSASERASSFAWLLQLAPVRYALFGLVP